MGHYKSIETTIIFIIFKAQIQKTKIMAPGPITSWQIDGETMERVSDFIFWGSKLTVSRRTSG